MNSQFSHVASAVAIGSLLILPEGLTAHACELLPIPLTLGVDGAAHGALNRQSEVIEFDFSDEVLRINNRRTGTRCEIEAGFLVGLHSFSGSNENVVLHTEDASAQYIQLLNYSKCLQIGKPASTADEISITARTIEMNASCSCNDATNQYCECVSAKVYNIAPNCSLRPDEHRARMITKRITGVDFVGKEKITRPGTEEARIAK
ncbi:hypothetical protein ACJ41P_18480 [Azospirillum argentinense]|uniref:Uncharacterized protein n=1 Tax=Azospirillum argentinense TaxID=2970906 RepID=A0ABW8V9J1_9PROT